MAHTVDIQRVDYSYVLTCDTCSFRETVRVVATDPESLEAERKAAGQRAARMAVDHEIEAQ